MKKKKKKNDAGGKPALDLIEEAVQLLRWAPWSVHLCYYTGSIPFVLGLLYFWSDMCRGAFAYDRIAGSSLQLAGLFVWMKCWQSVSMAKLRAFLSAAEEPRWTAGRIWRLAVMQAAVQPSALFLRPVALLITLPYGWVRAFYENAVILGDGGEGGVREMNRNARRMAVLWPRQNILLLLWLLFFGFVIWLNVAVLMIFAPQMLRMFTGIETIFTENPYAVLNTTFLATSIACTYLCLNPLTKAAYVLRCFYGESLHSGDDLRLEVRKAVAAAATAALLMLVCAPATARAEDQPPAAAQPAAQPATSTTVKTPALDDSITRVLKRDEFAWRMPRQAPPDSSKGFFARFMDDAGHTMGGWAKSFGKWFGKAFEGWFKDRQPSGPSGGGSLDGMKSTLNFVLWAIFYALVIFLVVMLVLKGKGNFRKRTVLKAKPVTVVPDLNSEDVVASQLPEDEWLKMAREMMEKGELRLAIRALYLATLSHLGLRELISIARHKSNRDYMFELRRRARERGELLEVFGQSVSMFEGVWYGSHTTTGELVQRFSANIERIKLA